MSISSMFRDLGAPLRNMRWSWGAISPNTGAIFLRVWKDDILKRGDGDIVRLTNRNRFEGTSSLGYAERVRHIELLRQGAKGYLIFCESESPAALTRKLKSYVSDKLYPTGELCEVNSDVYVQFLNGISADKMLKR